MAAGREARRNEHAIPMMIGAIRQTRIALRVSAGGGNLNRRPIWKNDPVPSYERSVLTEGDFRLIAPDQPRPLRNQNVPPGDRIVHGLRHLGDNRSG